jgi:hypothetical protein
VILLGLSTSVHPCRPGDLAVMLSSTCPVSDPSLAPASLPCGSSVVHPGRRQSERELGPLLFGSAPGVISFSRSCCD